MNKELITKLLSEIKYPGFSRDIISFGILKNINISDDQVILEFSINTTNDEIVKAIVNEVNQKFDSLDSDYQLKINFQSTSETAANNPNQVKPLPNIKNIIAVASGKGGVGKSTVSINLASSLSKNHKVGILDLDIYGPSLPMIAGSFSQPKLTEDQKLIPIEKFNMELMSFGFINNDNNATIWRGPMVARLTQQFFNDVKWGELDYLIIDLPPGTGDIQLTLVQKLQLTGAVIVTTPQDLSLIDAKKAADMFNKVNTKILGIIENMSDFSCPSCNHTTKIFPGTGVIDESDRLNIPILGKISIIPELAKSMDSGRPYIIENPDSELAKKYHEISSQINAIVNTKDD